MANVKDSLKLLFDRPKEPIFMPKGNNNAVFQAPPSFLETKYQNKAPALASRFDAGAGQTIPLKNIAAPNLTEALKLPKQAEFSLFIPNHQKIAASLIDIFMKVPENQLQDLLSTCAFCRDKVNPQLFNYCLSVAFMHRTDTRDIDIPNVMETFPSKFSDSQVFQEAREVSNIVPANIRRNPIEIPRDFTASDFELEHRVAYFREDVGINLHHWHWHLVYPFTASQRSIVDKNRRGELFFYMHQQIVARYNCERLSNMLPRVKRFNNFTEPIEEGYFPKLDSLTAGRSWAPRPSGMYWQDLNRSVDGIRLTVDDITQWKSRIEEAINLGTYLTRTGERRPLTIDILGNMIEATDLSPNSTYYGNIHNAGHLFTAYIHDPDNKYLEMFSLMGDPGTGMRDPFFYRWHAFIDDLFQRFKSSAACPPYTRAELSNPDIRVTGITVNSTGVKNRNELKTFWMQSDVDFSRGLDFSERGAVLVRYTHLNHLPFTYTITCNNSGQAKMGTVRIFMAPKNDERGLPWQLADQRVLFIEMDRFVTQLRSGNNTITRQSTQSSVTIPFERTFRDLSPRPNQTTDAATQFNYCGCGWPQHMLVPKGTPQGSPYELFVMISNYDQDRIDQSLDGVTCAESSSFCGIKDRLYPDRRDMGFPFDRPPNSRFNSIRDFLQPNMAMQEVTIRFTEKVYQNPKNPTSN